MLNKKSKLLVVVISSYNRLQLLKQAIRSVQVGTRASHEIIVIDAGSSDGTIEYLRANSDVTPVFQNEPTGVTVAYNQVWRQTDSKYTVWLSDDTEIAPGILDLALDTLERDPTVGMVNLKMKDTHGPWRDDPWRASISEYGILTCQHGVLRTALLRELGYAREAYRSYVWNNDLVAAVLCTGLAVPFTKKVAVWHHRMWAESESMQAKVSREAPNINHKKLYHARFAFLEDGKKHGSGRQRMVNSVARLLFRDAASQAVRLGLTRMDFEALGSARFISLADPLIHASRPFYFVQQIPRRLLERENNPYRHLVHRWAS